MKIKIKKLLLAIFIIALVGTSCAPEKTISLNYLVKNSRFIFEGTVQKLNASNLSIIKETANFAIVKVENIIDAPSNLNVFKDREITVLLKEDTKLSKGQKTTFFTNDWLYGESIAVIETGRLDAKQEEVVPEKIKETRQKLNNENLKMLLTKANLVVSGKVIKIHEEKPDETNRSEHDPEWKQAEIKIDSILKGDYREETVLVNFPSSRDVMWVNVPKFKEGQEAIWLLFENQLENIKIKGYSSLFKDNIYSKDDMELIKKLILEIK